MILRKNDSTKASGAIYESYLRKCQPPRTSSSLYLSLVFFTYFVALCSGAYAPYRPHKPHLWSFWSTPAPLIHTYNGSLALNATAASYETTIGVPVDDRYDAVIFDDDGDINNDVNSDVSSTDRNTERAALQTSTPMPNVTVVTMPNGSTEVEETEAPRTPEEDLGDMLESLDNLLSNDSAVVTVADVTHTFDQLDVLLDSELEFPRSLLQSVEALGARAALSGSQAVLAWRNVAVVMADATPAHPVRGLRVSAADGLGGASFEVLNGTVDSSTLSSDASDAVVSLPPSMSELSRRVSFVVFASDRAFTRHGAGAGQYVVNSKVVSVTVDNFTMGEGEVIDIHFKPSTQQSARNLTRSCAHWHFAVNGTGYWSQTGCIFIHSPNGLLDICRCTHLTHFAEVLVPKAVFSESDESALAIISLIGCFLSLFGLFIIGLTAILFRAWRNDFNNKIWLQLTLALFMNVICFLIVVFSKFEDYNQFCFFVGILLHYAVLASFCWMLVAAVISYRKLVLIFARDQSRKLLKASAFSWFFPLVVITILVVVAPDSYAKRFEQKTPNGAFCYPVGLGLWLTVYTPIFVIVLINWILFALILRSVFATRKIKKHGGSSEMLRRASVSCLLVFLFGLPWVFGLFAYNIVAAYFFALTTSYQGFVLFIFFVIINTKTRGMWLTRLLGKKKTTTPVVSSLMTNKSDPVRDESEQAFIEPSSARTNVTSLMSDSSGGRAIAYDVSRDSVAIQDTNSFNGSDESFKTAQSFANVYVNETDDYKSIPRIVGVIEKAQSKPVSDNDDISSTETLAAERKVSLTNDKTGNQSLSGSNMSPKVLIHNKSKFLEDTNNGSLEKSRDSPGHRQGSDDDSIPELKIYNVPTQSASLIK